MSWWDISWIGTPVLLDLQPGKLVALGVCEGRRFVGVAIDGEDEPGQYSIIDLEAAQNRLQADVSFPGVWGRERPIQTVQ